MSKYEIMTVLAPGTDLKVIEDVLKSVFDAKNIEKNWKTWKNRVSIRN